VRLDETQISRSLRGLWARDASRTRGVSQRVSPYRNALQALLNFSIALLGVTSLDGGGSVAYIFVDEMACFAPSSERGRLTLIDSVN